MFCEKCGTKLEKGMRFCEGCGCNVEELLKEETTPNKVKNTKSIETEKKDITPVNKEKEQVTEPEKKNTISSQPVQNQMPNQQNMGQQPIKPQGTPGPMPYGSPATNYQYQANNPIQPEMPTSKKKLRKPLIIGASIAAAIVVLLGGAFIALGGTTGIQAHHQVSLGNRYLDDMEYEQAIAAYEAAIEIDPSMPDPYIGLAKTYMAMEEYDEAIEILEEGLDATDNDSKIEEFLDEIMEELRGFAGYVYIADMDLDNSNNNPLEGIHVEVEGEEDGECDTDEDGYFSIDHLPEGEYSITFSADGYVSYTTTIDLENERHRMEVVLEPAVYATMYGNVMIADADMDFGNNDALGQAEVELHKLTGSNPFDATVSTDGNGQYIFDGIVMGVYELTVTADGYQTTEQTVMVYEGQTTCYNVVVEVIGDEWAGEGTASGTIYDALTGYGVDGLTLNFRKGISNLDGQVEATTTTDEYGYYVSPELESGNYTIEIVDELRDGDDAYLGSMINVKVLGGMDIPNQDGTVSTTIMAGQVRIVMSWGSTPSDLDSHLFCNLDDGNTGHVYFGNKTFQIGDYRIADLDLDDTDYYGPETTTIYMAQEGTYTFGIYDYSGWSDTDLIESGAVVQVYLENSMIPSYVFYVPSMAGYYWEVFTYDSHNCQLIPINEMYYSYSESNYYVDTYITNYDGYYNDETSDGSYSDDEYYDDYGDEMSEAEYWDNDLLWSVLYMFEDVVWWDGYIDSDDSRVQRVLDKLENGVYLSNLNGSDALTQALRDYAGMDMDEIEDMIESARGAHILVQMDEQSCTISLYGTDLSVSDYRY